MATGTLKLASYGNDDATLTVTYDTVQLDLTRATVVNNTAQTFYLKVVNDDSPNLTGSWTFAPHSGTTTQALPRNLVPIAIDPSDGSIGIVDWTYQFGPNPPQAPVK